VRAGHGLSEARSARLTYRYDVDDHGIVTLPNPNPNPNPNPDPYPKPNPNQVSLGLSTAFMPLARWLSLVGKFAATGAFNLIYIQVG
jgi:hypothetical protein